MLLLFSDHYSITLWSKAVLLPEVVYAVLKCPSVSKLVFPAQLPIAPRRKLLLNAPEEFDLALVPKVFKSKSDLTVNLVGMNGIELGLLISYEKSFSSTFELAMPLKDVKDGVVNFHDIKAVFMEVVHVFQAYGGRVFYGGPKSEEERNAWFPQRELTINITLGWLTYYGQSVLDILGRDRFERLVTCKEKVSLNGGILIILQEEPLDMTNSEHVARKRQAEHELGFDELAKDEKRVWRQTPTRAPESEKKE